MYSTRYACQITTFTWVLLNLNINQFIVYREGHLDPIFVCFCGLLAQIISIFKATMETQKLIKLEERDPKKDLISGTLMSRSLSNTTMESIKEYSD